MISVICGLLTYVTLLVSGVPFVGLLALFGYVVTPWKAFSLLWPGRNVSAALTGRCPIPPRSIGRDVPRQDRPHNRALLR